MWLSGCSESSVPGSVSAALVKQAADRLFTGGAAVLWPRKVGKC